MKTPLWSNKNTWLTKTLPSQPQYNKTLKLQVSVWLRENGRDVERAHPCAPQLPQTRRWVRTPVLYLRGTVRETRLLIPRQSTGTGDGCRVMEVLGCHGDLCVTMWFSVGEECLNVWWDELTAGIEERFGCQWRCTDGYCWTIDVIMMLHAFMYIENWGSKSLLMAMENGKEIWGIYCISHEVM